MESNTAATKESETLDTNKEDMTNDENPFDIGNEADENGNNNTDEQGDIAQESVVDVYSASNNDRDNRSKTPPKPPRPPRYTKAVDTAAAQKLLNGEQEQEQDNPFGDNPFAADDTKVSVTTSLTPQSVLTMNTSSPTNSDNMQTKDVPSRRASGGGKAPFPYMDQLKELMLMGFRRSSIEKYLREARGSVPVASAQMCNLLKSQHLYVDSQIWHPVLQAKVVAWMPNMVEEGSTEVHTGYVINISHSLPFPNSWKVTIRFRVFQKFHNEINKFISRALAPDSLRNPFPSSLGGWFKANDDKARNERMKLLGDWLNEVVSTSILCGTPPIWNALCDFLQIKENLILKPPTSVAKHSGPLSQNNTRKFAGGDLI